VQGGLSYAFGKEWGLFATITRLDTKTDVEAIATVPGVPIPVSVKTTIDLRPVTYATGVWYRF
jgi:outer membrane protein W